MKFISMLVAALFLLNFSHLNPINLTLSFLIFSIIVSFLALVSLNKWFFYVFVLFYVGGMMVMFVYVVSLLNTEKFLWVETGSLFLVSGGALFFLLTSDYSWPAPSVFLMNMYKSFELMSSPFLALVLLLVLIAVVKLCDSWKGSLKSKMNE